MAAPTQDKIQITPARISDIANDLKTKHTPAIAKEIDALFAPLTRELPPTKVKLDAALSPSCANNNQNVGKLFNG